MLRKTKSQRGQMQCDIMYAHWICVCVYICCVMQVLQSTNPKNLCANAYYVGFANIKKTFAMLFPKFYGENCTLSQFCFYLGIFPVFSLNSLPYSSGWCLAFVLTSLYASSVPAPRSSNGWSNYSRIHYSFRLQPRNGRMQIVPPLHVWCVCVYIVASVPTSI